ncbi:FAD-binding protein [Staphylococcus sp. Mo2-7]
MEQCITEQHMLGATTGQQLLYALDEQVRSFEVDGLVTKYEGWEFLGIVKDDDNMARGIVAQNVTTSDIESFGSDAVIMATGGPGIIFGKTTNSMINTGSASINCLSTRCNVCKR